MGRARFGSSGRVQESEVLFYFSMSPPVAPAVSGGQGDDMLEVPDSRRFAAGSGSAFASRRESATRLMRSWSKPRRSARRQATAPFSLLFLGPTAPMWPQRIYRVEHDAMGSLRFFSGPGRPGRRRDASTRRSLREAWSGMDRLDQRPWRHTINR